MSPFPQYRSKVLTSLLRQLSSLRDRTQSVVRKAGLWSRWSLEAALYPIYRWEQVSKTLKRQLGQTAKKVVQTLSLSEAKKRKAIKASSPIEEVLASIQLITSSDATDTLVVVEKGILTKPDHASPQRWFQQGLNKIKQITLAIVPFAASSALTSTKSKREELPTQSESSIALRLSTTSIQWVKGCIAQLRHTTHKLKENLGLQTATSQTLIRVGGLASTQKVQGIATRLSNRHLVFVTTEQTILDILTIRQQSILKHKINWVLHHHSVKYHLQQARNRLSTAIKSVAGFLPTRALASAKPQLSQSSARLLTIPRPRVQPFSQVSKWIIRSVIGAIASLPFVEIPALAADSIPQPRALQNIDTPWIDPAHLKTQLSWDQLQGMTTTKVQGRRWLTQKFTLTNSDQTGSLEASFYAPDNGIEIPIQAEFLGYEPHLLEQVLGWIDRILVIVETAIASLWHWIGLIIIAIMSSIQKVKQFILP